MITAALRGKEARDKARGGGQDWAFPPPPRHAPRWERTSRFPATKHRLRHLHRRPPAPKTPTQIMPSAGERPFLWLLSFRAQQKKVTRGAGRSARGLRFSSSPSAEEQSQNTTNQGPGVAPPAAPYFLLAQKVGKKGVSPAEGITCARTTVLAKVRADDHGGASWQGSAR
jgi:hypothetical protein